MLHPSMTGLICSGGAIYLLRKVLASYGVGGARVVSGTRVVREENKNAGGPGRGSPPAEPVKGGGLGGGKAPRDPPLTGLAGGLPPPGHPAFFFSSDDTGAARTSRRAPGRASGRASGRTSGWTPGPLFFSLVSGP